MCASIVTNTQKRDRDLDHMRRIIYSIFWIAFATVTLCCNPEQRQDSDTVGNGKEFVAGEPDEKELASFLADAIRTRYDEVKLAELASLKSSNLDILSFAQDLANGHTNSLTAFQALAEKKGMSVPRQEHEETKETINELSQSSEKDFDERWCDKILTMHKKSIQDLKTMSNRTDDAELLEIINRSLASTQSRFNKLQKLKNNLP